MSTGILVQNEVVALNETGGQWNSLFFGTILSLLTSFFMVFMAYAAANRGPIGLRKILVGIMLIAYCGSELSLHIVGAFWFLNAIYWYCGIFDYLIGRCSLLISLSASLWFFYIYYNSFQCRDLVLEVVKKYVPSSPMLASTRVRPSSKIQSPDASMLLYSSWNFWKKLLLPMARFHYSNISYVTNLEYHIPDRTLNESPSSKWKLDAYFDSSNSERGRPVLIYIHGGGWKIGDKAEHGIPLLFHMASKGWICFTINYRLSPKYKWPAHIIDCKRAIAWVKQNAERFGGSPDFVAISGGSAGGHLATLAALTPNDPAFEPNLDLDSCVVNACVSLYGVYDFYDRNRLWPFNFKKYITNNVLDPERAKDPEEYQLASPMDRIATQTQIPFFAIHGDFDELVPVESCHDFLSQFQKIAKEAPTTYLELPGAHHAFDMLLSPRTIFSLYAIENFLFHAFISHKSSPSAGLQTSPFLEAMNLKLTENDNS